MKYLTFDDYISMGGTLADTEFNRFEIRAECEINNATFGRVNKLSNVPEEIKRCMFELVIYLSNTAKNGNSSAVSGFSNDGYSVTYAEKKTADNQIYDIIYTYLSATGLMYCGTDEPTDYNFTEAALPDGYDYLLVKKQ